MSQLLFSKGRLERWTFDILTQRDARIVICTLVNFYLIITGFLFDIINRNLVLKVGYISKRC